MPRFCFLTPFPNLSPSPCSQSFSLPLFPILVSKLCSIPLFPTSISNSFSNPCNRPSILVPSPCFPLFLVPCPLPLFPYVCCQPLFPTPIPNHFPLPLFAASVHYSRSQPLFLILVSNFCSLALFPICFNLFPTSVPNLLSQRLPPNVKILYIAGSCCIRQKGIPKGRNISIARSETRTFCSLLQGTLTFS